MSVSSLSFNRTLNGIETTHRKEDIVRRPACFNRTLNGIETA